MPLTPYLSPHERTYGPDYRILFDCLWPKEWKRETDIPPYVIFRNPEMYPKELQDKIIANWKEYGFKD
jgi:4-hydroxy-3-polyprenylbenzoate decarboxylase